MELELVEEIEIPAETATTVEIDEGDYFRIVSHEGQNVADVVFINRHDREETYCSDMTVFYNQSQDLGDLWQIKHVYSRPPDTSVMATVTEDRMGHHFPVAGGMCSPKYYETRGYDSGHESCANLLLNALNDYGLDVSKVPEVFNVGMNVEVVTTETGRVFEFYRPEYQKGDFLELRAEMDLIVAVSACPDDINPINMYDPTGLKIEVLVE